MTNSKSFYSKYHPFVYGILSAFICGVFIYWTGQIEENKAEDLITKTIDNFGQLFNTITLASATILALLLAAVRSSRSADAPIKKGFYIQIINLTTVVSITFIASIFSFQLLLIPIANNPNISLRFYDNLYWAMLIEGAILTGLTITIGLMLRLLIINIIKITVLDKTDNEYYMDEKGKEEVKDELKSQK